MLKIYNNWTEHMHVTAQITDNPHNLITSIINDKAQIIFKQSVMNFDFT